MRNKILTIAILLLSFNSHAQTSTCLGKISRSVMRTFYDCNPYVCFNYEDETGKVNYIVLSKFFLEGRLWQYPDSAFSGLKSYVTGKMASSQPVEYNHIGGLQGYYVFRDEHFYRLWMQRGRQKFVEHFFEKKTLKAKYARRNYFKIVGVAFRMGILLVESEGPESISIFELIDC